MWIIARYVFLGLVFLFRAFWRRQGVDQSVLYRGTRRVTFQKKDKIYWGLELNTSLIFALTRESWQDRVGKFFGVATELQTGDAAFDKKVYVAGDHPALHALLAEDAEVRRRIVGLFDRGAKRIFADGRNLWVEPLEPAHASDQDLAELNGVCGALKRVEPAGRRWFSDPFLVKAIAVEALIWTLALYGAPALVEQLYRSYVLGEEQRYLDLWALVRPSLMLAGGLFVGLMGLIIVFLRGSSRGHRIILESAFVLGLGLPLSSIQMIADYNMEHDVSAPRLDMYRVVGNWDTRTKGVNRRRTRAQHFLVLKPLTEGAPRVWPHLKVSTENYLRAPKGAVVKITTRAGRLNIPWLVRLEVPPVWPLPPRGGN